MRELTAYRGVWPAYIKNDNKFKNINQMIPFKRTPAASDIFGIAFRVIIWWQPIKIHLKLQGIMITELLKCNIRLQMRHKKMSSCLRDAAKLTLAPTRSLKFVLSWLMSSMTITRIIDIDSYESVNKICLQKMTSLETDTRFGFPSLLSSLKNYMKSYPSGGFLIVCFIFATNIW